MQNSYLEYEHSTMMQLVSWSLTSLFSTNMAISETIYYDAGCINE